MAPPPLSTPSSSRFLLSKRQSNQSQTQTPSQPPGGPPQFRTTPRLPASSTPHPSSNLAAAFTTPSTLGLRTRSSNARPAHDAIDSSPESPGSTASRNSLDPIELDSPFVSQSPARSRRDGPSPKRRRISISPDIEPTSSPPPEAAADDDDVSMVPLSEDDPLSDLQPEAGHDPSSPDSPAAGYYAESDDEAQVRSPPHGGPPRPHALPQQHPTFHRAPRFMAPAAEGAVSRPQQYPLPDAFSPQRRGARYVPGGLAAELRDWLVEVKGRGGDGAGADIGGGITADADSDADARAVEVDEVCAGQGMWLVTGRQRGRGGEGEGQFVDVRAILAGEGRLSGLARRNEVVSGCVVQVLPPAWDIDLQDGRWSVACDWHVLRGSG